MHNCNHRPSSSSFMKKGGATGRPPKKDGVGRALLRRQQQHQQQHHPANQPSSSSTSAFRGGNSAEERRVKLVSVLEQSSLDDFLSTALMSQREFTAIKERDLILLDATDGTSTKVGGIGPGAPVKRRGPAPTKIDFRQVKVPRRPRWKPGVTSPAELDRLERESFLHWRRELAEMEEASGDTYRLTPFEKNLEVWRQLWRVIERSDLVVQIVDARNPLFYYSQDLHHYAMTSTSPPRPCLILVNKADFLTSHQRKLWAGHFTTKGWNYAFFSAREEQEKLSRAAREEAAAAEEEEEVVVEEEGSSPEDEEEEEGGDADGDVTATTTPGQDHEEEWEEVVVEAEDEASRVLTREELLVRLSSLAQSRHTGDKDNEGGGVVVGMVGFPNVGKSSVINVLLGVTPMSHTKTRVAVSSTPGKTKHFQTLQLDDGVTTLCDCPGLVFPSFVSTAAEMVCAGVLPIAQLRDHLTPVDLMCRRLPRTVLESFYAIRVSVEGGEEGSMAAPTAADFLRSLCETRGYMAAGSGVPDVNRAARMVLWDYVEGRLFFCHPPEGLDDAQESTYIAETTKTLMSLSKVQRRLVDAVVMEESGSTSTSSRGEVMSTSSSTASSSRVRPSKRWGKKGRKLRDKDPYGEKGGDLMGEDEEEEGGGKPSLAAKAMGRKGQQQQPGGFTRTVLPHHPTYRKPEMVL